MAPRGSSTSVMSWWRLKIPDLNQTVEKFLPGDTQGLTEPSMIAMYVAGTHRQDHLHPQISQQNPGQAQPGGVRGHGPHPVLHQEEPLQT